MCSGAGKPVVVGSPTGDMTDLAQFHYRFHVEIPGFCQQQVGSRLGWQL